MMTTIPPPKRKLFDWEDVWAVLWEYFIAGFAYSLAETLVGWLWTRLTRKQKAPKRKSSARKGRRKQSPSLDDDETQE
jgi:hypothetical protein